MKLSIFFRGNKSDTSITKLLISRGRLHLVLKHCLVVLLMTAVCMVGVPHATPVQAQASFFLLRAIRAAQLEENARVQQMILDRDIENQERQLAWFAKVLRDSLRGAAPTPAIGLRFSSNEEGAQYEVPHGRYHGDGLVGIREVTLGAGLPGNPLTMSRTITRGHDGLRFVGSGWNFEPGSLLKETYVVNSADYSGPFPAPHRTMCTVHDRFQVIRPNRGATEFKRKGGENLENLCTFFLEGNNTHSCAAFAPQFCNASRPTEFWSQDGQILLDVTNRNAPILRYPDGDVEQLGPKAETAYIPFNEGLRDFVAFSPSVWINGLFYTDRLTDRNGNITSYSYDANTGWLKSITDPKGRTTEYARDTSSRVTSIRAPGPGSGTLTWQMTWQDSTWNPAAVLPDIVCSENQTPAPCPTSLPFTTLSSLQIPDGRNYVFTYGPWGRLETVRTPEGSATQFSYGTSTTTTFQDNETGNSLPEYIHNLNQRRLTATTTFPQGFGGPGFTTQIEHERSDLITSNPSADCTYLNWIKRTYPLGKIVRQAICGRGQGVNSTSKRTFAQELWQGGTLLDGTYYGNTGNLGDFNTTVGAFYVWDHPNVIEDQTEDLVPTKIIHKRDGLMWAETFDYELSNIPTRPRCTGCSSFRTTGNVIKTQILNQAGNILSHSTTSFLHNTNPAYATRNLIRLPASVTIRGGGAAVTRTDYGYDEYAQFPLVNSSAQNLDTSIGTRRGNVTTVTQYADAANAQGAVSSHTSYFNTGDVQNTYDANGNPPSTKTYDFGICSTSKQTLTNSMRNAKGHQSTSVVDCNTGATLKVTDPNNQSTYTQYDSLGRVVETAGPGDTLTPIPGFIRAADAPLNGGTVVGNNGRGPTSWIEYLSLGVINQQRIVVHTKDGTSDGYTVKTFKDGLGRTIQTRSEVDPNTSSGNSEVVSTTEYDSLGQVSRTYVPVYSGPSNAYVAPAQNALATVSTYDASGRVTSVRLPGLPATTNVYGITEAEFSTTTTDAKGNQAITHTDILGRKVRVAEQSSNCTDPVLGNWCVISMNYDEAGRLTRTTDPQLNQTTFRYDGLGRKKQMTDPDMGRWTYTYDNNGNLISQTDARGQTINISYDSLNRMKVKDLPPNNSSVGPEDTTYFYDGEQPPS